MKKLVLGLAAAACVALSAPRADAKLAAIYGSGQGGLQNTGDTSAQFGFEVGARVLLVDGYIDYMSFGSGKSVSRAIVGMRGGFGLSIFRLVLRGGVGAIREDNSALSMPVGDIVITRTGGVVRAGAALEGRVAPMTWLGLGVDGEEFGFLSDDPRFPNHGSDVLGTLKLTFELGI